MPKDAPPNGDATLEADPMGPRRRVSEIQAKLHRWAVADPGRRFDDLFNLVHDPATLIVAFDRVAGNRGAKAPGVDGMTVADVEEYVGAPGFLNDLRTSLKDGSFRPLPVRERTIPKPGRDPAGWCRRQGPRVGPGLRVCPRDRGRRPAGATTGPGSSTADAR